MKEHHEMLCKVFWIGWCHGEENAAATVLTRRFSANPTLTQRPVKPSDWPSGDSILRTMAPSHLKYFIMLLLVLVHAAAFGKTVISRRIVWFGGSLRTNGWVELAEIERQSVQLLFQHAAAI